MQKIIDEYSFYEALSKLDLLTVELNDAKSKIEEVGQAMTALQQELYSAVSEVAL